MRIIITRKSKQRIVFIVFVVLILTFTASCLKRNKKEIPVISSSPISRLETDSPLYTVIGIADSDTSSKSLTLFGEICSGFGITPTVFAETGELKRIMNVFSEINGFDCDYGIICENTSGMTRSEFLTYLALLNDRFYGITGTHSLCCYINGTNSLYSLDVMASYGQYGVSYSVSAGEKSSSLKKGDIVAVILSDEASVYGFASLASNGVLLGLNPVSMKEYIKEYEYLSES